MREVIKKLSKGIIEYETPMIETSVSVIKLVLEPGIIYDGNLQINTVNGMEIKGVVYSTNDNFQILNNQFFSGHSTIHYRISSEYMQIGDAIEGRMNFVCSGGELEIPYTVCIEAAGLDSSRGKINHMDLFLELIHQNYEEALALFYSPDFGKALLSGDLHSLSLYENLKLSNDKNTAMEEFLIGIGKKQEISAALSESEKIYQNMDADYSDSIIITKDSWGYISLEIEAEGEFLKLSKNKVTSGDFVGNHYELSYIICSNKLHGGVNPGRICIKSGKQNLEHCIQVNQYNKTQHPSQQKKYKVQLTTLYLEFRMQKIVLEDWAKETIAILKDLAFLTKTPLFNSLLQAQMELVQGNEEAGEKKLNETALALEGKEEENISLYAYFLYVRTLQKQDYDFTVEISSKIKGYYSEDRENQLLFWLLLNVEEELELDKSLRMKRIREQIETSCTSPFIYFEAASLFNEYPKFLHGFDKFELRILLFAAKYGFIHEELARQITEITFQEKEFSPLLFQILKYLYESYQEKWVLEAVCSLLIKGNKYGQEYFQWFASGVEYEIKITKLYDYYIYSVGNDYKEPLPRNVLLYFIYNADVLQDRRSYLYYNIILNKERIDSIYRSYRKHIEKYAFSQFKKGNIDELLAVLYKEILDEPSINAEMLKKFPDIFCTYKLECSDPRIARVIVCRDEQKKPESIKLTNGKAYIPLYTNKYHIIFEDSYGNLYYKTVKYKLERLLKGDRYIKMYLKQKPEHELLVTADIKEVLKNRNNHEAVFSLLIHTAASGNYRSEYIKVFLKETMEYCVSNCDNQTIEKYLLCFDQDQMEPDTRKLFLELLIDQGMYEEAYAMFTRYGCIPIDGDKAVRFCIHMLEEKQEKDTLLLKVGMFAFEAGKYNEELLQYLAAFYYGSTREMLTLWKALKGFGCENGELEEKLLAQLLFTRSYSNMHEAIYNSYYEKGIKQELRHAFYNYESAQYYLRNQVVQDTFFDILGKELKEEPYMDDICRLAYLKHCSELESLNEQRIKLCQKLLSDLVNRGICLEFFKLLDRWFETPYYLNDKLIIEYKASPNHKIMLHYIVETGSKGDKPYVVEEMNSVYPGIFTKEFVLFYGEHILYYITEQAGEEMNLTESMNIALNDQQVRTGDNRYDMINNILLSMDVNDDSTMKELVSQYEQNKFLVDNMFDIM